MAWCSVLLFDVRNGLVVAATLNAVSGVFLFFSYSSAMLFFGNLLYILRFAKPGVFFGRFKIPIVIFYSVAVLFIVGLGVIAIVSRSYSLVIRVSGLGISSLFALLAVASAFYGVRMSVLLIRLKKLYPDVNLANPLRVLVLALVCSALLLGRAAWNITYSGFFPSKLFPWRLAIGIAVAIEFLPMISMILLLFPISRPSEGDPEKSSFRDTESRQLITQ